ncbi:CD209 antigen-like protein E [Xiphophorus maculatus]|uniref:CD209 antigen-like protein E n=1 Tax=Xiphophorus maculatus TaxID=8083 RepID=M4AT51_XIPMA|nr:CD209 antigen-like protein E [Xiphophorus maculatus]XP_023190395.1 CD209 antigen-like protein E [Xiphophorus maculatus]
MNMATFEGDDQMEYEEPASAAKSRDLKKNPGGKVFRLLLLSFGLLCILQSALNISLRLTSYCSLYPEDCDKNLTGRHSQDSGTDPAGEPDQNPTSQPAGEALKAQIQQMKELLCVSGSKAVKLDVDLKALPSSFKQQLATFCPSIYYFSSARETWGKSRKDCQERGADLVIINSREEQNFLSRFKERLWIGLTDTEKEGEWKWVDGTRLDTSYWGQGEPNSHENKDENCGEIRLFDEENNWNDVPCEVHNYWICERKLQG